MEHHVTHTAQEVLEQVKVELAKIPPGKKVKDGPSIFAARKVAAAINKRTGLRVNFKQILRLSHVAIGSGTKTVHEVWKEIHGVASV